MADVIVSEFSPFVLPSHRGLSRLEIIRDCLEKAQLLTAMGISCNDNIERAQCLQFLSMLDDWMALAQYQLAKVLSPRAEQPSIKQPS